MRKKFANLIGGKEILLSKKFYKAKSEFFPDYEVEIGDSSPLDISLAISSAKSEDMLYKRIDLSERIKILKNLSKKIKFSDDEILHVTKMTGMPYKYVKIYLNQIPEFFEHYPSIAIERYGRIKEHIGCIFHKDRNKIELRQPINGCIYSVLPDNDPRVVALVLVISMFLGIPVIIKSGKSNYPIVHKLITLAIESGFPAKALNLVGFDTSKSESKDLNFKLCDNARVIWPFGDDDTVDRILRLEYRKILDLTSFFKEIGHNDGFKDFSELIELLKKNKETAEKYVKTQTIDHFNSKIVLRHASGRCAAILDEDYDVEKAGNIIFESAMKYPIGCNSIKSVFAVGNSFENLIEIIGEKIDSFVVGDPTKKDTDVGYVNLQTMKFLMNRLDELRRTGLISIVKGGDVMGKTQVTPLLITTEDLHSELLLHEIPAYILTVKKVNSFEQAVSEVNIAAGEDKKLAVAIFTNDEEHQHAYIHAHHIKIRETTLDLDVLIHEGNDYIMKLTRPVVVTYS